MKNWFKKLLIPSGEKAEVIAYNSWIVRWKSARDDGGTLLYSQEESEIFPSEIDAAKFANQLRGARRLLKDRNFNVKIEANQSKMATMLQ